jgi:hypothetical protein
VWTNLESVAAYSYRNRHQEALSKRTDWFLQTEYPVYATWWTDEPKEPSWDESLKRIEHLHDEGSSAYAFDFKTAFDADGQPVKLDRPTLDRHAKTVL